MAESKWLGPNRWAEIVGPGNAPGPGSVVGLVTNPNLKFAIIVGSTRPGRVGASVAQWVADQAKQRSATYDLVDLADFDLDLLNEADRARGSRRRIRKPQDHPLVTDD
ncbi:MAG: NAD(P)H-dependent oxidoreductase [Nocardioidaceae bacterium]